MTDFTIDQHVRRLYGLLLANPQAFASRGSLEQVILGFEMVLNAVAGTNDRPDGYRRYLEEQGWGMFSFDARYETKNHCIITFVDKDKYGGDANCAELHHEYIVTFTKHWEGFLQWRDRVQRSREAGGSNVE